MKKQHNIHYLPFALSSVLLFPAANGYAAETTLLSINSAGESGNGRESRSPATSISADGRYVAFSTWASNLVALDFNWLPDVFVHDRATGTTIRVSVDSAGGQGHGASQAPSISADGRYVAFASTADNLVGGDTNAASDVFVHDLKTGHTSRVSINPESQWWILRQSNGDSTSPSISADGRFVAFSSVADNLVPEDTNGASDIFVHDRRASKTTTTRISVDTTGQEGNSASNQPFVSADGRYVAFSSDADNLVPGDTNGSSDIFVHDRTSGATTRISVDSADGEGNDNSVGPSISADGRYVAFSSDANNLVPGDTNNRRDIFIHNRITGQTTRIPDYSGGVISADGLFVVSAGGGVFVHERVSGKTKRVDLSTEGHNGNHARGRYPAISADGRYVSFNSNSSNLVSGTDWGIQTYVRDRHLNRFQTADLQLAVTNQGPPSVKRDQLAFYVFKVSNNGPDSDEGGVKLIDVVSNGKVWSLSPSQGTCIVAAVSVCRFGTLAAGESATVTAIYKATGGNPMIQQVSVHAAPVDSDPDNNRLTVSTPVTP